MRVKRRRLRYRAQLKARNLKAITLKNQNVKPGDVLAFATVYNEILRLPWFLKYYRDRGIRHFFVVDNNSTDGSRALLEAQHDVSLWSTKASYRRARYGMDWMNYLLSRYGTGHWCLTVDPDELLIYPFCDSRPLPALTDWLDTSSVKSFGTMMVDMYPKGPINAQNYVSGTDPLEVAPWFDPGNYTIQKDQRFGNLWIQGGPRARSFFGDAPQKAPALNKVPLVRWQRHYAYVSSTHMMLPRGLNLVYDEWGGEKATGVLMHTKFLHSFGEKAAEEMIRRQHFSDSAEYRAYIEGGHSALDFWCSWSERYINWRQMEILGLMSKGNWA